MRNATTVLKTLKFLAAFFIGCLGVQATYAQCTASLFAGGIGTEADPYQVSTATQLGNLRSCLGTANRDRHYVLSNNIQLAGAWTSIGNSSTNSFQGTLDGQGKTIFGLSVNSGNYAGLFGYVGTNGQLKNINVVGSRIFGSRYAGGLVAYYDSDKAIENSSVVADSVSSHSTTQHAYAYSGGLVGYANKAITIANSYTSVNVRASARSSTTSSPDYNYTSIASVSSGGLVGDARGGVTITNSYATGNISFFSSSVTPATPTAYSGGLVGYASDVNNISYSYASGNIGGGESYGSSYLGGIFGRCPSSGTHTSVYYKSQGTMSASGLGSTLGISSKSEADLKKRNTFIDWDFDDVWGIIEDDSYPYLNNAPITIRSISDRDYTGAQIEPEPTVRLNTGSVLTKGTDYTLAYGTNRNVGEGTATVTGINNFAGFSTKISFRIVPKSLTIENAAAQNKTYDGTTAATITGTLSGVVEDEDVDYEGTATFANKDAGDNKVVTATVALKGEDKDNYTLTQPTGLRANITTKILTITLEPKTITRLVSDPVPTQTNLRGYLAYIGLVQGDAIGNISGTKTISHDYTSSSGAGIYPITLSGYRNNHNYVISYDNTDLFLIVSNEVTPSSSSITPSSSSVELSSSSATPSSSSVTPSSSSATPSSSSATPSSSSDGTPSSSSSEDTPSSSSAESTPILNRATPIIGAIGVQTTSNAIILQNLPANSKVEIYNLQGKQIHVANSDNSQILKIMVQTKGIYLVKINTTILRVPVM
ncbi:MAG: YDG domain-containing protein [Fibromonadales bacterium]|nr:YDG domain-containing protein [Fibromonadales bacterium]